MDEKGVNQGEFKKDFTKDYYSGIKGIYFSQILKTIIRMGQLNDRNVRILDFGCGTGRLSKMLPGKVIGYDVIPCLSQVRDWRVVEFDVVVANEVFELFSQDELRNFLTELRSINPAAEVLVGTSRQGILNTIASYLGGEPDAHRDAKLKPKHELRILIEYLEVIKKSSIFHLCDVYLMRFKNRLG